MKVVEYDPKKSFGLTHRVYPFLKENAEVKGWEFSYSVFSSGDIQIFHEPVSVDAAEQYVEGLQAAIALANQEG
jgi:hypothetical protein